mgnify:CR=1 FL=1
MLGVSPVSEYVNTVEVAICTPPLYTLYPTTPTASVDEAQAKLIWVDETAVAVKLPGTVGAVTSGAAEVVAEAVA